MDPQIVGKTGLSDQGLLLSEALIGVSTDLYKFSDGGRD